MIISASYRTDIPAFYSEWFFNRLRAGYCSVVNPYSGKLCRVELGRDAVDGLVFWTRNFAPVLSRRSELDDWGRPWVVQFTATGYPRPLETSVIPPERAIEQMRAVREHAGPLATVWRYDTILFTEWTPPAFHVANFQRFARELRGVTNEVVISFAHLYRKTVINLGESGAAWYDPDAATKRALASELVAIARDHAMRVTVCSQYAHLVDGAAPARCVDSDRLAARAGYAIPGRRKGNRPECECDESRDIGAYDTCPHGCAYCYAVRDRSLALSRYKRHDPEAPAL